jgi:hypothetical protein
MTGCISFRILRYFLARARRFRLNVGETST